MKFSTVFLFAFLSILTIRTLNAQIDKRESNDQQTKSELSNVLAKQTSAWNDGDLEKFMEAYWKSEKLTFSSGGKTTRGWEATLNNYKKSYAPPNKMGHLNFDELEITLLSDSSALILGQWHLSMKADKTEEAKNRDGNFSLVVQKLNGNWKIIHDHSSSLEPSDDESKE